MGGRLSIVVSLRAEADLGRRRADDRAAERIASMAARRVAAWAARLTRFADTSDLSRLNADPSATAAVRPTLAAVLSWAEDAADRTGGMADVTLLRERLAAETGEAGETGEGVGWDRAGWRLSRGRRGGTVVRWPGLRFDLDGVAKGWIADRALWLLADAAGAVVDADGDIAIRLAPGDSLDVGVADPRDGSSLLASLRVEGAGPWDTRFGIATSGVSVHRWERRGQAPVHHLIDPRTRRPATTDVVQATVLAHSAREAEVLAKTAVILGRDEGLRFLDRAGALAAVVLTDRGECVGTPATLDWMAA
jgi:thiamine biosynthesis lipoprotein